MAARDRANRTRTVHGGQPGVSTRAPSTMAPLGRSAKRTLLASNEESVQVQVLKAARRLSNEGKKTFRLIEVVDALPKLNEGTVRTHVSSRCCVNAPGNHPHRWPYFHRVRRGVYRLREPYVTGGALRRRVPKTAPWSR